MFKSIYYIAPPHDNKQILSLNIDSKSSSDNIVFTLINNYPKDISMAIKKKQKILKKSVKKAPARPAARPVTKPVAPSFKHPIMPLGDRVLVRPFSAEEIAKPNSFGIIIPETVQKEKPEQGEVVAVGPGHYNDGKLIPVKVKVGDIVLFSKYGFDDVTLDSKEFYILKEESILAIINK